MAQPYLRGKRWYLKYKDARGRWQADLYALARRRLARAGVEAVYGAVVSTYADPRRFYSHRRDGPCGRMASLIWLSAT